MAEQIEEAEAPLQIRRDQVEAEVPLEIGRVEIVRKFFDGPIDISGSSRMHHLELTLLPNSSSSRFCFPDRWGPDRFEPNGELFLLPAQLMVRAKSDCRQQISIVCWFDPGAVAAWLGSDLEWTESRLQGSLDIVNSSIRSLLFRIGEEIRNPGFASETLIELMAGQVTIELSRHLAQLDQVKRKAGLPPWCLKRIDERLADGGSAPALFELAALCNLSVRHLTRAFRASRGRSIGSYIAENRINHAKQLLALGLRVKSVAHSTGFTAASNFAAAFLRATGESPRQYRRRMSPRIVGETVLRPKIH
jgi:AraC family transcriptional regulator